MRRGLTELVAHSRRFRWNAAHQRLVPCGSETAELVVGIPAQLSGGQEAPQLATGASS